MLQEEEDEDLRPLVVRVVSDGSPEGGAKMEVSVVKHLVMRMSRVA